MRTAPTHRTPPESNLTRVGLNGVNIRGIGGNRGMTQVDGVDTSEQFDFGPFNDHQFTLNLDTLKSAEIVRSAGSALYGSDALGGVVSLFTKDPLDYMANRRFPVVERIATLPEGTSSFGAAVADGWLYVYGGHVVRTHSYSTEAVSGRFNRLNLATSAWETLPAGPPLQGMNLVAHGGKIYRVGGMQPQNAPGTPQDIRSVTDVARFDPQTGRWEALPPLPLARSSHDVVVVGNTLFVVGGWNLKGGAPTEWPDSMELLDLTAAAPAWHRTPQPFRRRALTAAARDGKVHVLGGFDDKSQVVHGVSIYDVAAGTWSSGPTLPGGAMSGFGPAACVAGNQLYVSVDDGGLHRLGAGAWEPVGRGTPRIVHRCVPSAGRILVLGGAYNGDNSNLVEGIAITP